MKMFYVNDDVTMTLMIDEKHLPSGRYQTQTFPSLVTDVNGTPRGPKLVFSATPDSVIAVYHWSKGEPGVATG